MDRLRRIVVGFLLAAVVGLSASACLPASLATSGPAGSPTGLPPAGSVLEPPSGITPPPVPTPPAALSLAATGLGPCREPWYRTCNYGIRVEGPGGYDHRGNFAWDEGKRPAGELGHGSAANVSSTGIWGDVPTALGPGVWTVSFRLWYGSDAVSYAPVPGGTPRYAEEDPFSAACSQRIDTTAVLAVALHVAFKGSACAITAAMTPRGVGVGRSSAALSLEATGLSPCDVTFPYTCQYLIRLDGPAGYEHYGWFNWDPAAQKAVVSSGVGGDLPGSLSPGDWTFSFAFVHRGDLMSYIPVPGGTPRTEGIDPREVGCTQRLHVTDELSDRIEVAFTADRCRVTVETAMP